MPAGHANVRKYRRRPATGLLLYASQSLRGRPMANLKLSQAAMRLLSVAEGALRVSYDYDGARIVLYAHPSGRYLLAADGSLKLTLDEPELGRWFPHRSGQGTREALPSLTPFVYAYPDPEASSWSPSGGAAAVPALKFDPGKPTITDDPIYADPGGRTDPPDDQPLGAGSEATRVRQPVSANGSA